MYTLHIAEKNSVAKEIAQHLSNGRSRTGSTLSKFNPVFDFDMPQDSNSKVKVTSVRGHVIEFFFPEEYKSWHKFNPRVLLNQVEIIKKPNPQMTDVVKNLESLARGAQKLVLWLDCDREGEAIAFEVIAICMRVKSGIPIRRARFSAVTRRDVWDAYNNLRNPNKDEAEAVEYRRQIDFRLGCCFTIFQTITYQNYFPSQHRNGPVSYGPCQFPTLGFVVQRYLRVQNFRPEKFWSIKCQYVSGRTKLEFKWKRNRLFDQQMTSLLFVTIFESFENEQVTARIVNQQKSQRKRFKPYPLATITLQKLGTQKLRMSSDQVMDHAQKLYQKGILSYPRTETNSFPHTMNLKNLVALFENSEAYGQYARKLLQNNKFNMPRNGNKNDNAHPPIHPVKSATRQDMTPDQWRVYDLVCRHFLACCSKDAEGEEVVTDLLVGEEDFNTTHLKVTDHNYLQIYPFDKWTESELPDLPIEFVPELSIHQSQTTPPTYLTETQLITLMDKNQIGTDSTIHEHIKTILTRNFAVKTNNTIKPTPLGLALVQTYNELGIEFAKCDIRRSIEQSMNQIAEKKVTKDRAVQRTLEVIVPIYDRLSTQCNQWVGLMRRFLPREQNLQQSDNLGLCGACSVPLVYSNNCLTCPECSISLNIPYGKITLTDHICPICNFPCLTIENESLKFPRQVCPKCYSTPDRDWMADRTAQNLQCSKCTYNCKYARGFKELGLFVCPVCKTKRANVKGTGNLFVGCSGWPGCQWSKSLRDWIKQVKILNLVCPVCQEERRIESQMCCLTFDERFVQDTDILIKIIRSKEQPSEADEILQFCLHPQCNPQLYESGEFRPMRRANTTTTNNVEQHSHSFSIPQNRTLVCFKCNNVGHIAPNCPQKRLESSQKNKMGRQKSRQNTERTCYNCGQAGHFANACTQDKKVNKVGQSRNNSKDPYCYNCKASGHLTKNCPNIIGEKKGFQKGSAPNLVCFKCNQPGHIAPNCPKKGTAFQPSEAARQKKGCPVCGCVGRHPKNSNCTGKRKKKQGSHSEDEQF